jgi:hypothetical protein
MEKWKDELQKLMLSCHVPDGLLCEGKSGLNKAKTALFQRVTVGAAAQQRRMREETKFTISPCTLLRRKDERLIRPARVGAVVEGVDLWK